MINTLEITKCNSYKDWFNCVADCLKIKLLQVYYISFVITFKNMFVFN